MVGVHRDDARAFHRTDTDAAVVEMGVFAPTNATHATFTVIRVGGLSDWRAIEADSAAAPAVFVIAKLPRTSAQDLWRIDAIDICGQAFVTGTVATTTDPAASATAAALNRKYPPLFDSLQLQPFGANASTAAAAPDSILVLVGARTATSTFVAASDCGDRARVARLGRHDG
ncbi:MAG: hypothetical protein U5N85_20410 [Arcicella sp.]|nr:hypothetical protein [Arcicella sp.]